MTSPLNPRQAIRRGLRIDDAIPSFAFTPSVGLLAGRIDKLGIDIRSFREPLKRAIQQVLAPSFRKNFQVGGRPDAWEDLSDATLEIRDRAGVSGDQILVRSGLLMKTIQQLNIWHITPIAASIQDLPEKIWYGKVHQSGYSGSGGGSKMSSYLKAAGGDAKEAQKLLDDDLIMAMRTGQKMHGGARAVPAIPQRQFVMIQEEDYDEIERIFAEWLTERAERVGLVVV